MQLKLKEQTIIRHHIIIVYKCTTCLLCANLDNHIACVLELILSDNCLKMQLCKLTPLA